jgi:hypothetical protein
MSGGDHNQLGAKAFGAAHGHGRANAEHPGGIEAGRHHTTLIRFSADGEGLSPQIRVFQHFDSTEKGIQIQMKDFP